MAKEKKITQKAIPRELQLQLINQFSKSRFVSMLPNWIDIARMETSGFMSKLFTLTKNPWNMRPSIIRKHSQNGFVQTSNGRFAKYDSYEKAVEDILLYMEARKFPDSFSNLAEQINFMGKKGYYGEESPVSYFNKVMSWRKVK